MKIKTLSIITSINLHYHNFTRKLSQLLITTSPHVINENLNKSHTIEQQQISNNNKDIEELYDSRTEIHDLTVPAIENSYLEKWINNEKDIVLPPFSQRKKYISLLNNEKNKEYDFDMELEKALIQCFQGKRYRKVVRDIMAQPGFLDHCYTQLQLKMKLPTYPIHAKSVIYVNKKKWYKLISKKLIDGTFNFRPIQYKKLKIKKSKKPDRIFYVSFRDRMIMEAYKIILSKVYEMKFKNKEIFVPGRSHHEVLKEMKDKWKSINYFIEFPIEIQDEILNKNRLWNIIENEIEDTRFFDMLNRMCKNDLLRFNLNSGIGDHRRFDSNVLFTLFLEIYLTKLDAEVLKTKYDFEVASNKEVNKMRDAIKQSYPSQGVFNTMETPEMRTLHYVRHRHHFLLGIVGDRLEAKKIYRRIITFLKSDLKFEKFPDNARLVHASSDSIEFLGMTIACPILKKLPRVLRGTYLHWVSKTRKQIRHSQEVLRQRYNRQIRNMALETMTVAFKKARHKYGGNKEKARQDMYKDAINFLNSDYLEEANIDREKFRRAMKFEDVLANPMALKFLPKSLVQARNNLEKEINLFCKETENDAEKVKEMKREAPNTITPRMLTPILSINAPIKKIKNLLRENGIISHKGRPGHLSSLVTKSDEEIVRYMGNLARFYLNYYRCADNFHEIKQLVNYQIRWSVFCTMARKHKSCIRNIIKEHSRDLDIQDTVTWSHRPLFPTTSSIKLMYQKYLVPHKPYFFDN